MFIETYIDERFQTPGTWVSIPNRDLGSLKLSLSDNAVEGKLVVSIPNRDLGSLKLDSPSVLFSS